MKYQLPEELQMELNEKCYNLDERADAIVEYVVESTFTLVPLKCPLGSGYGQVYKDGYREAMERIRSQFPRLPDKRIAACRAILAGAELSKADADEIKKLVDLAVR